MSILHHILQSNKKSIQNVESSIKDPIKIFNSITHDIKLKPIFIAEFTKINKTNKLIK